MEIIRAHQVRQGDIIEGSDGPELVTEVLPEMFRFRNKDARLGGWGRMMEYTRDQKIVRYISRITLIQSGIPLEVLDGLSITDPTYGKRALG